MTKTNPNIENENSWTSWATGKLAMYAIGIAAGIFIWRSGLIQKATGKLFSKKKEQNESQSKEY